MYHINKLKTNDMTTFNQTEAKENISEIFNNVSFRKFGNAFRKHVSKFFKAEYNTVSVGGQVNADFTWSECASYIIGDGNYTITEEQYNNFVKEF